MTLTKAYARKSSGKRKRTEDASDVPTAKKRETSRPPQTTYDEAISMMDPSLMSDHYAKSLKKHFGDSTTIELEDKYIPTKAIRDTTSFSEPHLAKNLPAYLEIFCGGTAELVKGETAKPHTLVITSSGIRAADLARELRTFSKEDVKIAKLFAKHMKMVETVTFVEKTKINIGVGTPTRPRDLIEHGALRVDGLKRIVIDGSYIDEKKRTIFDLSEVFLPLVALLNTDRVKNRLGSEEDTIDILIF